ncbi:Glutamate--tRNA ligase [Bienertia sinuspersici]
MSFQCASDDSHCGSCNYVDADIRDRDRLDSEAESMIDFQTQKRCSGDRFSCNRSVTSNTTRNASMSDSLYSSGRWLGDDGFSHSDAEFVSGSWHNDIGGPQSADVTASLSFPDSQYQLMCVDDRLLLELQSIGLYLDAMPDLADGEEVIDRDITDLKEGLCEQIGKKKNNLVKIDKALQDDKDKEKWYIEQVAMEQLIQMAYKRRMACRRNNASKTVMRKVSKQVAMGFIERTLVRCKNFELTGQSCFREPALQNVLFAAPQVNDAGAIIATGASKCRMDTAKADVNSFSVLDSCIDDFGRGYINEHGFPELEPLSHKSKRRELLLDDVGGPSSRVSVIGEAKDKRSDRERDQGRSVLMTTASCEDHSVVSFSSEQKPKTKLKNSTSGVQSISNSVQWQSTEPNKRRGREMGLSSDNAPEDACQDTEENIDFDDIEKLGISNDPNAPEDFSNWLTGLQDYDSIGLEIPMDDLNMVVM